MRRNSAFKPRKKPSQRRSKFTVEQIMEAAAQVFAEHGSEGGTTNRIAERAGVSIGSLYQYFPNKEAILVALFEQHIRSSEEALRVLIAKALAESWGPERMIQRFIRTTLELHTSAPRLHHVLLYDAPRPPEVVEQIHRFEDAMAATVTQLLSEHLGLQVRYAGHAAYIIVHVVEALAHEFVIHPPKQMDEETFIAEVVVLVRGYLLKPCPAPEIS